MSELHPTAGGAAARGAAAALLPAETAADGCLLVARPAGPTSHDVVAAVRRRGFPRVGHAGTLDPAAQGVLVVFLGEALKVLTHVPADRLDKTYLARVTLGVETDTWDAAGAVLREVPLAAAPPAAALAAALDALRDRIEQAPPPFSALRVQGRRAHELARAGAEVTLAPRPVTVSDLQLLRVFCGGDGRWQLVLRVSCSRGTYVRALARELGARLGCGAHLSFLLRERVGVWSVADATPLHELRAGRPARPRSFVPLAAILPFPRRLVTAAALPRLAHGRALEGCDLTPCVESGDVAAGVAGVGEGLVQVCDAAGRLLALYRDGTATDPTDAGPRWRPVRVLFGGRGAG